MFYDVLVILSHHGSIWCSRTTFFWIFLGDPIKMTIVSIYNIKN